GLRELTGQRQPPLRRAGLVVGVQAKLRVQPLEGAKVGLQLLGQFAEVTALELADPLLLLVEAALRLAELDLEELRGARGLPLARFEIFLDVERRERVGDDGDRAGVTALVTDREGHGRLALASRLDALEVQLRVRAHPRDDVLERDSRPEIRVEPEPVDQVFQSRSAEDFLR